MSTPFISPAMARPRCRIRAARRIVDVTLVAVLLLGVFPATTHSQWQEVRTIPSPYEEQCFWLDVFFLPADPIVFKTINGGVTWYDVTPWQSPSELWGLYFLTENEGVVIGGGCTEDQVFYYTSNGGASWVDDAHSFPNSGLSDAILLPSGAGYASSSGWIWRTSNRGYSWNLFGPTGPQNNWQEEITLQGSSILVPYSAGCTGGGGGGGMIFSRDLGNTWWRLEVGASMFGAFLVDADHGWACGESAALYYTSDAGQSWYEASGGIAATDDLDDLSFVSPSRGYVVGDHVYRLCLSDPTITSNTNFIIPPGGVTVLDAGPGYDTYLWSTGERTRTLTVSSAGTYTVSVSYNYGCSGLADVEVFDMNATATLLIPELTADPHDLDFPIPVRLVAHERLAAAVPISLRTIIEFNPTLFAPRELTNGSWTDLGMVNGMRQVELSIPVSGLQLSSDAEVLTEIRGAVLLGNSTETPLRFTPGGTSWTTTNPMTIETTTDDGRLTLDASALCNQGGTRLLATPFGILKAAFTPGRDRLALTVRATPGQTCIVEIHALNGRRLFEQSWTPVMASASDAPMTVEATLPLGLPLHPGLYFVSIRSEQQHDVLPVPLP